MKLLSTYKKEYSQTLKLAIPVIISQAGQVVMQLCDNAMVGHLGKEALAGASFANMVFFFSYFIGLGISLGLTPVVGKAYAQHKHKDTARYFQNSLLLNTLSGVILCGVMFAITPLLYHLGQPVEVVDVAIPYFHWLTLSIIPFMLFATFKQFLEGVGNTKVAMVIIITSNVVNIVLNWVLIYGKFGLPEMGTEGAGLSTFISRIITPIMVIIYFVYKDSFRRYFKYFLIENFKWKEIRLLLKVGSPIAIQILLEGGTFSLIGIMMGWLGTTEIASNQIATIISNLAFSIALAVSSATTIRVSHAYGEGDLEKVKRIASSSYHIGLVWGFITATLFITFRNYIPLIFTSDPEVVRGAANLLIVVSAFQISDGLQNISIGVLRGLQDVKITVTIAFTCYILTALPVSYICGFIFGWGDIGLWVGLVVGLSLAAVLANARYRKQLKLMK